MRVVTSAVGGGTPMITHDPPQSSISNPCLMTSALPTQSNAKSTPPAPIDPVGVPGREGNSSRTAATTSVSRPSMNSLAPKARANGSFAGTVSMAIMQLAPAMRSACMTFSPTPPTPNTAAVWPRSTLARLNTDPTPVRTPQPTRQADDNGTSSGIFTACTSCTTVASANTELAAKLHAGSPLTVKGCDMLPTEARHQVGWPLLQ